MTWALDLDGVVWLAGHAIPGSAEAISELRSAGERVVFLTNNSGPLVAGHVEALAKVGVQCAPGDVATSAQAAASMLSPGSRVAVVGDKGILEALDEQGVKVVGAKQSPRPSSWALPGTGLLGAQRSSWCGARRGEVHRH